MTQYISTRGDGPRSFTDVLLSGLAPDGGLYVPKKWPKTKLASLAGYAYTDIAYNIIKPFIGDEIDDGALKEIILDTYESSFSHSAVAPLVQIGPSTFIMELFHGPTLAFKDYALQVLGRLFDHVLAQRGERVTIVGATSGDTGSAAIEACRNCENIDIFILHPKGRTSEVQRRQMTTIDSRLIRIPALICALARFNSASLIGSCMTLTISSHTTGTSLLRLSGPVPA